MFAPPSLVEWIDRDKGIKMWLVHDMAESLVGDIIVDRKARRRSQGTISIVKYGIGHKAWCRSRRSMSIVNHGVDCKTRRRSQRTASIVSTQVRNLDLSSPLIRHLFGQKGNDKLALLEIVLSPDPGGARGRQFPSNNLVIQASLGLRSTPSSLRSPSQRRYPFAPSLTRKGLVPQPKYARGS